jgi:hypothetical protein
MIYVIKFGFHYDYSAIHPRYFLDKAAAEARAELLACDWDYAIVVELRPEDVAWEDTACEDVAGQVGV